MYLHLNLHYQTGQQKQHRISLPCPVGKHRDSGLTLVGWGVAKHHACFVIEQGQILIEDLGSIYGTFVNAKRISRSGPLCVGDEIIIGPCRITIVELGVHHEPPTLTAPHSPSPDLPDFDVNPTIQKQLHLRLIQSLNLQRQELSAFNDAALRQHAAIVLSQIVQDDEFKHVNIDEEIKRALLDEAIGLGPIERLLERADVNEIMVNGHQHIYIERDGVCELSPYRFSTEAALLTAIERIVSPLGRRIDDSSPMVDARLKDGSRVHAVIAPIAIHGPSLTIRKFATHRMQLADLVQNHTLSQAMADFIAQAVEHKKNIVVSGGTGSGKTTLLNILSSFIPLHERIITIEDAAELKLKHGNLVALEARPENTEGKGAISIRELVRNALRMRPDRIVVGECRGPEAFDMLAAMNTGHEGSMTTLHANSARDALGRLETLILMAGMDLPLIAVREHIAAGIQLIVQQQRLANGARVITSITEITGLESGRIQMQELFYFDREKGQFCSSGIVPACFSTMHHVLDTNWFYS